MKSFLLFFIVCLTNYSSNAQIGALDRTFGDTGLVIGNYPAANTNIAMQKDGKFIAGGGSNGQFFLVRYNNDGSIDEAFGNKGLVITDFLDKVSVCESVAVQSDGKIVAGGLVYDFPYRHIALARYNTDGSLDMSFGTEGLVDYGIAKEINAYTQDMVLQPDGKILITGTDDKGRGSSSQPFITRFNNDGSIDKTFGSQGTVFTNQDVVLISSIGLQSDGKILIGGTYAYLTSPKFMLLRYFSNGTIDSSFGTSGLAKEEDYSSQLNSIAIQKDGSIIAGGYVGAMDGPGYMKLIRFTNEGIIDSSFGEDGISLTQFQEDAEVNKVLIQNDGKIIGSGTLNPGLENAKLVTVRYLINGDVDASFGVNGSTSTVSKSPLYCTDALLQDDGKILTAAETYIIENTFAFARYLNNDKTQRQILITRIKKWIQHHNGFTWDKNNNVSNYVVQRSNDGINWSTLFSSRRSSNNQQPVTNSYVDPSPLPGTNYYRLQTTSVDGAVAYSNVIAIGNENSSISISPNPAKSVVQISGLSSSEKTKIMVVDLSGNMAISPKLITNSTSYNLNIAQLKPGNYMLRIESNGGVVTKQFVKE